MRTVLTIAFTLLPGCRGLHVYDCDLTKNSSQIPASNRWKQVSLSKDMGCALNERGQIACWSLHRVDPPECRSAHMMKGRFTKLATLGRAVFAVSENGKSVEVATASQTGGRARWETWRKTEARYLDVAVGDAGICVVNADGGPDCELSSAQPYELPLNSRAVGVSVGKLHVCIQDGRNLTTCFGAWNDRVHRSALDGREFLSTADLDGAVEHLVSGANSACATTTGGSLWCWGDNRFAQLGTTHSSDHYSSHFFYSPTKITLPDAARGVSIGPNFACGIVRKGDVYCWGYGGDGALGVGPDEPYLPGDAPSILSPKRVPFVAMARDISVGGTPCAPEVCVVDADGDLTCWGTDRRGGNRTLRHGVVVAYDQTMPNIPEDLPKRNDDECPVPLKRRANWIPDCHPKSKLGIDANDSGIDWIQFEREIVTVTGRFAVDRWGWLKGGAGGRDFGSMYIGSRVELRTDLIRCEPTIDECDTEGWTLTVQGTVTDTGSELAGHPIVVPESICRRAAALPGK